ncbi:AsmA family protein [Bartonella sp. DGB2]|uniref:AsmA family protein n=1 Tax=Bartonella sp. DGB2 TaxID=3388426 RepID=UPI00398FDE32
MTLPYVVSTEAIRLRLARDLSLWTGYHVALREAPKLQLLPYPRASLSGVSLTPFGEGRAAFMEAERIDVDLSLPDILWGGISFSQTRVINPKIIIEAPIQTAADFFDSLSRSHGSLGEMVRDLRTLIERDPDRPDVTHLVNQPFGRIVIKDGVILYRTNFGRYPEKITNLNATLDWPVSTHGANFRANAQWHGEFTDLQIDADKALLLLAGGTSRVRVSLNSVRGGLTFDGDARLAQNFFFSGRLAGHSLDWEQTCMWLGFTHMMSCHIQAPVVWGSGFLATPNYIKLADATFSLGEDKARGALEVALTKPAPVLTGSLAFKQLDLTKFEQNQEALGSLSWKTFMPFALDIRLSIKAARYNSGQVNDVAMAIKTEKDNVLIDIGNASAFGGVWQSHIQIKKKPNATHVDAQILASGINVEDVVQAAHYPAFVTGKGNVNLRLKIDKDKQSKCWTGLEGNVAWAVMPGALKFYDFNEFIKQLASGSAFTLIADHKAATAFNQWSGEASFSEKALKLSKSDMTIDKWIVSLEGDLIPFPFSQRVAHLAMVGQMQATNRQDYLCHDTECLQNSLVMPFIFTINNQGEDVENIKVTPRLTAFGLSSYLPKGLSLPPF